MAELKTALQGSNVLTADLKGVDPSITYEKRQAYDKNEYAAFNDYILDKTKGKFMPTADNLRELSA